MQVRGLRVVASSLGVHEQQGHVVQQASAVRVGRDLRKCRLTRVVRIADTVKGLQAFGYGK